jgi:RNA polymerase sigma factor (sigma-70 family)
MTPGKCDAIGRQLEQLWTAGTLTGLSDSQVLGRFAEARGRDETAESAFQELIHRHGTMVLGVCRQILRDPHDADDAFQATFLVLVRQARSIRVGDSLAPWLYGVAYRTAQRARAIAARYRPADVVTVEEPMEPSDEVYQLDLRPLLHEELNRLPAKYRDPIVLCHLEGKTHEEAARLLAWPVGTVSGRLSRGRQLLRSRLERRGVVVSSAMLATNWLAGTPATVSLPLIESTLNAAFRLGEATAVSSSVLSLAEGVLRTMLLNKLKLAAVVVLVAGGITGGVGAWAYRASGSASPPGQDPQPAPQVGEKPASVPAPVPKALPRPVAVGQPLRANLSGGMAGMMSLGFENVSTLRSQSIIVVQGADGTSWEAMSVDAEHPTWKRLTIPPEIKVYTLMGPDTVALGFKGKSIDHLAAFSQFTGEWSKQHLLKPVEGEINPIIGP